MKTIIKTFKRKTTIFICEICGRESEYEMAILNCEKSHKCHHTPIFCLKEPESGDDCYGETSFVSIAAKCSKCGVLLPEYPEIDLEDIMWDKKLLKMLYIKIRRSQRIDEKEKEIIDKKYGTCAHDYLKKMRNKE